MGKLRNFIVNTPRTELLLDVSILGLLASLLLTSSAWGTIRTYPLSPIIPNLSLAGDLHTTLFLIACTALILSLFRSKFRSHLLSAAVLSLSILVLLDNTRLQPWVFHYSAVLFIFSSFVRSKHKSNDKIIDAARIVVGGIYFWSGIQKLNLRFMTEIFPWFTEPIWSFVDINFFTNTLIALGILVPIIEAFFGFGFFIKKLRTPSLIAASCMLVLVMLSIGPLGHNWNSSVWPWNFAILFSAGILFWKADFTLKEFIKRQRRNILGLLMFGLFWIMPAGNFVGLTDNYLSWSLYSGKVPEAILAGDQLFLESLSEGAEDGKLSFVEWTHSNMNIVPYPETRVFTSVFNTLCDTYPNHNLSMQIRTSFGDDAFSQPREYTCPDK